MLMVGGRVCLLNPLLLQSPFQPSFDGLFQAQFLVRIVAISHYEPSGFSDLPTFASQVLGCTPDAGRPGRLHSPLAVSILVDCRSIVARRQRNDHDCS